MLILSKEKPVNGVKQLLIGIIILLHIKGWPIYFNK